jgi:hypothetical protein
MGAEHCYNAFDSRHLRNDHLLVCFSIGHLPRLDYTFGMKRAHCANTTILVKPHELLFCRVYTTVEALCTGIPESRYTIMCLSEEFMAKIL